MRRCKTIISSVLILLSISTLLAACRMRTFDVHMFSDLSECYTIESLGKVNEQIIVYDSPYEDKYIGKLEYNEFYACSYLCDELQFDLFAYEFSDHITAKKYFEAVTGKEDIRATTFSDVKGLRSYRRIVIDDNYAYAVYTTVSQADVVTDLLNQMFSRKVITVEI